MGNLCKSVVAGLVLSSIVLCPTHKETSPKAETNEIELLIARQAKHRSKAEAIIKEFPTLWHEYIQGDLQLTITTQPQKELRAYYDAKERVIMLYCTDDMSACPLGAMPHELAHYIMHRKEGSINHAPHSFSAFGQVMQARRLRTDAHEFNSAQEKLSRLHPMLVQVEKNLLALNNCSYAKEALNAGEILLGLTEKYEKNDAFVALADSQEQLTEKMKFCTDEQFLTYTKSYHYLVAEQYFGIYTHRNMSLPGRVSGMVPGKERVEEFYEAFAEHDITRKAAALSLNDQEFTLDEEPNYLLGTGISGLINSSFLHYEPDPYPHDVMMSEQFAAAVDSLIECYVGPWNWPPLNFTLTPDMLHYFAWYEYKGEHIFAPHVKKYRRAPGLEEYWESIGIDVPGKVKQ